MNWKFKAIIKLIFSNIQVGGYLDYIFQRYFFNSFFYDATRFHMKVLKAKKHIDLLVRHSNRGLENTTFFEFGAGWNLLNPLVFYSFGANNQIVIDSRNLLKPELINDTIKCFQQIGDHKLPFLRIPGRYVDKSRYSASLKNLYGIQYISPCDASHTGFDSKSVDFITSTNTLEHIPAHNITLIMKECRRILKDDGVCSFRID